MRLIDADELMKSFGQYVYDTMNPVARRVSHETRFLYESLVRKQQTAYDMDKVVEQLEGEIFLTTNDDGETNDLSIRVMEADRVMEIIKSGGIERKRGKMNEDCTKG